jgi:hypothetical protein
MLQRFTSSRESKIQSHEPLLIAVMEIVNFAQGFMTGASGNRGFASAI